MIAAKLLSILNLATLFFLGIVFYLSTTRSHDTAVLFSAVAMFLAFVTGVMSIYILLAY